MGCVACQKVPVTATVPVIVVLAKLTTHGDVDWVTATVPVIVVLAKLTGCVVCQKVPDTGRAVPPAIPCTVKTAVPETPAVPPPATIQGDVD
jgi:hypothetical protein